MDELHDVGFEFRYPVWMLDHPKLKAKGIINTRGPDGERAFLLFTDGDLADRFRASDHRLAGYNLVPIPTWQALDEVLRVLQIGGFTHVIFDHPGSGVGIGVGSPLVAIATLRERIQQGEQDPGESPGKDG
jgi:hypothetical protein